MPGRIKAVGPNGEKVTIPAENMEAAIKAGYRQAGSYEDMPGAAAVVGAGRGASAGLSDFVIKHAVDDPRVAEAALSGLKEQNPVASGLGEAAGTVGAAFLPVGPVAGISKLGAGASRLAGAGVKGVLARGAVEGTLFGLGGMISEDSIGNKQENAEKLAGLTGGALFGAGINTVTHGLGAGASALVSKLGGTSLNGALTDLADKALEMQIGNRGVMKARNLQGQSADEIFAYARKAGLVNGGDTAESFLSKVIEHRKGVGAEMGDILAKASERQITGLDGQPATQVITDGFDGLRFGRKVREELIPKLQKSLGSDATVSRILSDVKKLENTDYSLADAWKAQSTLGDSIGRGETEGMKSELRNFQNMLRDEIKEQASEVSPHFGAQLDEASGRYMKSSVLKDLAKAQVANSQGRGIGTSFPILGGMLGGPVGFAKAAAINVGKNLVKERGGFMLAAAADKLAQSEVLNRMAANLKVTFESMGSDGLLGAYRLPLENAAAKGAMNLLATHVQLAQSDPKYLPTLGMQDEDPQASGQYAAKGDRLHALETKIKEHDAEVEAATSRFLGTAPGKAKAYAPIKPSMEDFNSRMARINQVIKDPTVIDTSGLASTAPGVAAAAAIQANTAAQFLLSKAPKNPGIQGLPAFAMPWQPSQSELEKFYRYIRTVERPVDVLHQLNAQGAITPEAAETMRTVYPTMLEDMKNKMMNRLTEYDKKLPYDKKRAMDSLYGSEFRGVNPMQVNLLQGLHSASVQGSGGSPAKDGRQTHTQAENMDTQAVKMEKGRSKP